MTCGYERTKGTWSGCGGGRGLFIAAAIVLSVVMLRARAEHGEVVKQQHATHGGAVPETAPADRLRHSQTATANPRLAEITSEDDLLGDMTEQATPSGPSGITLGETRERTTAQELSVQPGTLPLLPEDAPAWITSPPDFAGEVHRLAVGSLITEDQHEANELLDEPLVTAVREYIDTELLQTRGAAARMRPPIDAAYIRRNFIDDAEGYVARMNAGGIPMFQKWVLVTTTPAQRAQLHHQHVEAVQRIRLGPLGLSLFGLLGSVGLFHLVLRRASQPLRRSS